MGKGGKENCRKNGRGGKERWREKWEVGEREREKTETGWQMVGRDEGGGGERENYSMS